MSGSIDPNEVLIRHAFQGQPVDEQSTDAEQIARIYNHYVDAGGATFDKSHWSVQHVATLLMKTLPDAWFVAECNGDVLGWASVGRFSDRHGFRHSCETAIYLDPVAVGKSIGDRLQRAVESHCIEHGFHHATAKIIATNERSMRFHRRYGYQLVGIQKEIGNVDGKWVDLAILQRIFS